MRYNDLYNHTKNLNILYVEDEQDLRNETETVLESLFKTVVSAQDGQEGLELYTKYTTQEGKSYFDIILTDINMPIVDGVELIKKVYKINNNQTIIVISAHNESQRLINLINLGITNFIPKPFSREQFSEVFIKAAQFIHLEKEKIQLAVKKELYEYKKILLEDKTTALKDLLENIAHHWRQPLSYISTIAGGLLIDYEHNTIDPVSHQQMLNKIIDTTQDMSTTIDKFRAIMSLEQSRSFFNIKGTFESVIYLMKSKLINENVSLVDNIEDIAIYQIEYHVEQLFINIFNNAIDAMKGNETKLLFIDIFKKNNRINIEIKDNGVGIDTALMAKLCEPYFTTKHKLKGTGLGLFVANDYITKEMGGTLEFQNVQYNYNDTQYSGTLVTITLPLNNQEIRD